MAKRFIDTGLFDDSWFMDLSKDGKILWIYFITKCNHAGIIKLNEKLCKVQTDIKCIHTVIKELSNRLVTVNKELYFIPKFIEYQYPGFPNSKVRQQQSAVDILQNLGLFDEKNLTVRQELPNSYDNDNDNDNDNGNKEGGVGETKRNKKQFVIPDIEDVAHYFEENGYRRDVAYKAWHYYDDKGWHDKDGKPVQDWKGKMRQVWFKKENIRMLA